MRNTLKQDLVEPLKRAAGSASEQEESLLHLLIEVCLNGRWKIVLAMIFVLIMGELYFQSLRPVYRADMLLQIEHSSMSSLSQVVGSGGGGSNTSAETQILTSRLVAGRVVDELGLGLAVSVKQGFLARASNGLSSAITGKKQVVPNIDVATIQVLNNPPKISMTLEVLDIEVGSFSVAFANKQLGEGKVGEIFVPEGYPELSFIVSSLEGISGVEFLLQPVGRVKAIRRLVSNVRAAESGKQTGLIAVVLVGDEPTYVYRALSMLGESYIGHKIENRAAETERSLEFLEQQLPVLKQQVSAAQRELSEFMAKNVSANSGSIESSSVVARLLDVERQISELDLRLSDLSGTYQPIHPAIVALSKQRERLETTKSSLSNELNRLPKAQQQVFEFKRNVEVASTIYNGLRARSEELKVIKAGTVSNVRLIDEPNYPVGKIEPTHERVLMTSLILGFGLGLALVLLLRALNRTISNPDELEELSGRPVYAVVPLSKEEQKLFATLKSESRRPLLAGSSPGEPGMEALRNMRTSLHFALMGKKNQRVLITGASPGVGKTYVASNLAYLLAESGKKTVLIDADMRRGQVHQAMSMQRSPGLSELIIASDPAAAILKCVHNHEKLVNLDIIPTGEIPPNPSELLMSNGFASLLDQLDASYDIIIIDSPPSMAVSDPGILMSYVDSSFLIVRSGKTHGSEILQSIKMLEQAGGNVTGTVLNAYEQRAGVTRYGGYSYYQYDYENK